MAIRIYALAKDLNVDSKELVEICKKTGIQGKGSALASLDDDEVQKVKTYLSGGSKPAAAEAPAAQPGAPVRTGIPARSGSPSRPITTSRPGGPNRPIGTARTGGTSRPATPPPAEAAPPAAEAKPAPVEPEEAPEAPSQPPPDEPRRYRKEDYIPVGGPQRVRVLGQKSAGQEPAKERGSDPADSVKAKKKPRAPVIKLASLPEAKQPTPAAKPSEPAPQKPEIRLPMDAIRRDSEGNRPSLADHIAQVELEQQQKPAAPAEKKKDRAPAAETAPGKGKGKRRGAGKDELEEEKGPRRGLAGMATMRVDRQKSRRAKTVGSGRDEDQSTPQYRRRTLVRSRKGTNTAAPRKGKVALELPCTVRSFSEATGVPSSQIQRTLMQLGTMATINAQIDDELVELLAAELGVEVDFKEQESLEDSLLADIRESQDEEDQLVARAPVVTFLGHVDHGKTSLLDYLIGINVVAGEAGGITQHIRAYQVEKDNRKISFVDTPGHEAFTEMRARGANVTDIAVLVIAADDGIMPQTEEAISHAKAAGVPIVVALNKVDLEGVDLTRTMTQLTEHELTPSEWGGDVEVVRTSAITGQGMDELLETLLTIAELHGYQANPSRNAYGTCLESEQQAGRGVIAKLIVQNGTLKVGDVLVCGSTYGRVKAMYDTLRPRIRVDEAGPSVPVNVVGLDEAPEAGEAFYVLDDIGQAREIAEQREHRHRTAGLSGYTPKVSFEEFQRQLQEGRIGRADEVVTLNLIIRADVRGSIEAIQKELQKLEHPEVQVRILQASVGGITTGDVTLAAASEAIIVGFNVIPDESARNLAEEKGVEIRRYDIIYKVTDDIKLMLEGRLKPEERVVELGRAIVKQVFQISRVGSVAGCYVVQGSIERNCRIRVNRDGRTIGDYPLDTLRRVREDVKEVTRGLECGIKLSGFDDIKQDDVLEAYKIEEVARTL